MNKKILLLWALCLIPVLASAQIVVAIGSASAARKPPHVIDTCTYRILYEVKSLIDLEHPDRIMEELMALEIGQQQISKYYSENARIMDSTMRDQMARSAGGNVNFRSTDRRPNQGMTQAVIFKNYPAQKIAVSERLVMDNYLYEEDMYSMNWQILPDTLRILSYLCQKAEVDFRGRHYEAWFSPEIPLSEGPWKFNGLPGLILRVQDNQEHYRFECVGIAANTSPITREDVEYFKASRKDVEKVRKRFQEDPEAALKAAMPNSNIRINRTDENGMPIASGQRMNIKYNPMELD